MTSTEWQEAVRKILEICVPVVTSGVVNPLGIREDYDVNVAKRETALTAITEATERLIIGQSEKHTNGKPLVNPWTCDDCGVPEEAYTRNNLRAEQREALGSRG
jgi:hypothetical protein